MKLYKIIPIFILVACMSSCGTLTKSDPFTVGGTKLKMHMDDLVFLGESEISCEYDTYFGVIRSLQRVNGEVYQPGNKVKLDIPQRGLNLSCKGMKLAASKLITDYPEARYFQVVMETKNTDVLFLGSTTKRVAKVRAYKFNDNGDKCCGKKPGCVGQQAAKTNCYTLDEIIEMVEKKQDVRGLTICAVDAINFDFNKSVIKPESHEYLNKLAETLKRIGARAQVKGHTDNVGSDEVNLNLSKERAQSVVNYLLDKGVKRSKLSYDYFGSSLPLTTNDTEEGRAMNRRVEIEILK